MHFDVCWYWRTMHIRNRCQGTQSKLFASGAGALKLLDSIAHILVMTLLISTLGIRDTLRLWRSVKALIRRARKLEWLSVL